MPAPTLLLAAILHAAPGPTSPLVPAPGPEGPEYRVLADLGAGEPGIAEVQRAAAREAERAYDGSEVAHRRTRFAALLPRITAEVRLDQNSTRVVGLQASGEVDYLRLQPAAAVVVRATWELRDLAGARGDGAAAARLARSRARAAAVRRATSLFFERRRALLALLLAPPAAPLARAEAELEIDRLGAELDALTGGLFTGAGRP